MSHVVERVGGQKCYNDYLISKREKSIDLNEDDGSHHGYELIRIGTISSYTKTISMNKKLIFCAIAIPVALYSLFEFTAHGLQLHNCVKNFRLFYRFSILT